MGRLVAALRSQTAGLGAVFYVSTGLVLAFVLLGVFDAIRLEARAGELLDWTTTNFGWLYLLATTGFVLFALFLALSGFGRLRLGEEGEAPEFSFRSWIAMIFSAGMGVGLVFWGVAEPMVHFAAPPLGMAPPRSEEAAAIALRYSMFHWGLHQWGTFAVVGVAIAYVRFRHNSRGLISEAFRPLWPKRVDGVLGHAIDVLAVVTTTFGVATTLGMGALQINSGLARVAGVPVDVTVQFGVLAVVAVLFTVSALTALKQGVRLLSILNMLVAAVLLVYVLVAGPTHFIASMMVESVGEYIGELPVMSFRTAPFSGERWVERWTVFYWAWGLSWAPFVGTFIARISRGRTIREFVFGVMFVPVALSFLWFSTFGGSALYFELFQDAGIADAVQSEIPSALFATFDVLGPGRALGILAMVLVGAFLVTSADSSTFVLGMFTTQGALNPGRFSRLLWGFLQVLVAGTLLLAGGLAGLRTISILAAFPFMLLMVLMAYALFRDLRGELQRREAAEHLLLSRVEALLLSTEQREAARLAEEQAHPTVAEEPAELTEEEPPVDRGDAGPSRSPEAQSQ